MNGGFEVELDVLKGTAEAVSQTMRDMESCRIDDIPGQVEEYGHDGLHAAFEHFCERWQEGVEILLEDGDAIGEALRGALASYREMEQTAEHTLRGQGPDPAAESIDG